MVHLGEVSPSICDNIIESIELALGNTDFQDDLPEFDWRKAANRRKFDRELFERYGYFKDIILHPQFQYVKNYLEENADFDLSFQVGEPLIPVTTAVILLFMLHKRVGATMVTLVALFIFNVNPLYVCIAALALYCLYAGQSQPRQYKPIPMINSTSKLPSSTSTNQIDANEATSKTGVTSLTAETLQGLRTDFDHILIGSDIGTLYTAALLAKNGHHCCVLQPAELGDMYEIFPPGAPCAAPIVNLSIDRIEKYQGLLDAATCISHNKSSTNYSERITFAPVGSVADGYTSAIVHSVCRNNTTGDASKQLGGLKIREKSIYTALRAGETSLVHDLSLAYPVDKTLLTASFQQTLLAPLPHLTAYLTSKCVTNGEWQRSVKSDGAKAFERLSSTTVQQTILNMGLEKSTEVIASLSALARVGAIECVDSTDCSAYLLASSIYGSSGGVFYPTDGPGGIMNSLVTTIQHSGGVVFRNVNIGEIILEEYGPRTNTSSGIRASGVSILTPPTSDTKSVEVTLTSRSVVSGTGILHTYAKLIPPEAVTLNTRQSLSNLVEALPRVKVVYWVEGDRDALGLTSTDYYEYGKQPSLYTPSSSNSNNISEATPVPLTEEQLAHNAAERVRFQQQAVHVWSPSCKDSNWAERHGDNVHVIVVELALPASAIELGTINFDTTTSTSDSGDISSTRSATDEATPPRVYYSTHLDDAHTNPASPDFVTHFGSRITMSKSKQDKLQSRADSVLSAVFPKVAKSVVFTHVHLPVLSGGSAIANTVHKYTAPLSAVTDIRNLYLTGRDLGTAGLAGDLQGGWVGANAVLGYTLRDLAVNRNIVADLRNVK